MAISPDTRDRMLEIGQRLTSRIRFAQNSPNYRVNSDDGDTRSSWKKNDQARQVALGVAEAQVDLRSLEVAEGRKLILEIMIKDQVRCVYPIERNLTNQQTIILASEDDGDVTEDSTPRSFDSEMRIVNVLSVKEDKEAQARKQAREERDDPTTVKDPIPTIANFIIENLANFTGVRVNEIEKQD